MALKFLRDKKYFQIHILKSPLQLGGNKGALNIILGE